MHYAEQKQPATGIISTMINKKLSSFYAQRGYEIPANNKISFPGKNRGKKESVAVIRLSIIHGYNALDST